MVDEIQYSLDLLLEAKLKQGNTAINIAYGNNSKRVKIKISDIKFLFPTALAETLGVDPNYFENYIDSNRERFRYSVDLNTHRNQLYIYSDVANYTFIGDITASILRVVPVQGRKDNVLFHQEFVSMHYVPVAKSFIDQVNVSIKDDTGKDIPFVTEKTLIKLHFREKNERLHRLQRSLETVWLWLRFYFMSAMRTVIPIFKPIAKRERMGTGS